MSTLYIVHGWAYSITPWQKTVDLLRASGVKVKQLNVPGLTAPTDHAWTVEQYVQWLELELASDPAPVVLAHSNGGRIALHHLLVNPQRYKHLILLNSAGIEVTSERLSTKRRLFRIAAKIFSPLKHIPYLRKIVYRLLGSDYGSAPPYMQKTLANMLATDKSFDPSPITTPTTILWGKDDRVTPPAMGRRLHELLSNSSYTEFDNWAHAPYRTHPAELARAISKAMEASA